MEQPTLIVFHHRSWDPGLAERIRLACVETGDGDGTTVLAPSDDPRAERYGVAGRDAVMVVGNHDRVLWQHVTDEATPSRPQWSKHWSRREFLAVVTGVAVALAIDPRTALAERASRPEPPGAARRVRLTVNGHDLELELEPRVTLLDALREYAGLTGTKKGCDHGQCGACTVHVDGRRTLSCLTFAVMQQGKPITTIEGLGSADALHPMQQSFILHDGLQCGYCTPGQIMSATGMIQEPWGSGDDDIREAMSGNICRCGAYSGIVTAIKEVRLNRRLPP